MGHSDLSGGDKWLPPGFAAPARGEAPVSPALPTLAEAIRDGDADALAGFHDAHRGRVRGYCTIACAAERVQDASDAAFVDFVGRLSASPAPDPDLDELLLAATRSAAAGRFSVLRAGDWSGPDTEADGPTMCKLIPELLAARANGELAGREDQLAAHLAQCPTCRHSEARMLDAERAFRDARGWDEGPAELPSPHAEDPPQPAAELRPRPVGAVGPAVAVPADRRRRTGGLVGAARQLVERARENRPGRGEG